jgi:biotin carboxylase
MKELENKKLLVIGASNGEVDVVKIAQSMGCYVIVTDFRTGKDFPAKLVADEAWEISWTDYDALEQKCREKGIEGVIAGFSEFRVESMIEMCERLHLPCYINREQLEITRDKNKFKHLCKQYGVPIVNEYNPDDANIQFPVIIKPTDRGGSIGINVAYNEEEYKKYLAYAYKMSPSKSVVVEDFIGDGVKFDCSYYINGKQAILIETCDTTMLAHEKGFETMQKAWSFPSRFENEYIEQVDANVKAMLADLGMECGVANISFFYRNGKFYVFETGFRLGGGHSFDYQRASGGIDYLTLMIKYAFGVPFKVNTELPTDRGYALTYSPYFKPESDSMVEQIMGEDEVQKLKETITYMPNVYDGYVIESDKPMKITMVTLYSKDLNTIINDVAYINEIFKVKTNKGVCSVYAELTSTDILNALKPNKP